MSSVEEIDAQNDQAETTSIKDDTHSVKSFGTQSTGGSGYSTEDEVSQDESEPTKPEDILYGRDVRSAAISNLILFSILLFTLPFAVMYFAYRYFTGQVF
jgi:hypothetical protein